MFIDGMIMRLRRSWLTIAILLGLMGLGLGLRLAAWHWHEFRPLGGDEREYLDLAIALAQGKPYYDLQFMRPPLFPLGLAALVWLVDGDLQGLRLINALISTATIPLVWWWARLLLRRNDVGLIAAGLTACSFTLALNATELLSETVTLAGLMLVFGLLTLSLRRTQLRWAIAAGVAIAVVSLIRSVALPLLPLGLLLLWRSDNPHRWRQMLGLLAATLLTIAPWTIRNALSYGGFILIDTTGQENLWLDNDPRGRDLVKAELYGLGDARIERSQLAAQQGIAAITEHPDWFLAKFGREFWHSWGLEHSDDLLARRAIWQPASEVWLRLIFGDGWWLLLIGLGLAGLWSLPCERNLKLLLAIWVGYTVFTSCLFHVEYRYRLPLLPVLLPAAAWQIRQLRWAWPQPRQWLALATGVSVLALSLSYANYPQEAWRLGQKHWYLWQAERYLADANGLPATMNQQASSGVAVFEAQSSASNALRFDQESALARVLLARVAFISDQPVTGEQQLRAAIAALPAHAYAHLLLGDYLRQQGNLAAARSELAYETSSTEDLQAWSRQRMQFLPITNTLDLGSGLDLGLIDDWYAAEADSRWFGAQATVWLHAPADATMLRLRIASERPVSLAAPTLNLWANNQLIAEIAVDSTWTVHEIALPNSLRNIPLAIELRSSSTFVPHDLEPTNPDGRDLGLRVDWILVE
ncbi:ArnT family glycosyltransferase [Herpetosiphon llansteffanensis]